MAMVVKNNMSAVRTLSTLNKNNSALQDSLSKVSSGLKINTAKDDASGYAISERMRVQIRSLDQATQNSQNASSLMKNAEGAVERTVEILRTLKQKAIDAATDTNTDDDRATIQKEIDQFIDQIDDNALVTFNGKYLLEGSRAQSGNAVATHVTNSNLSTDTNMNTTLGDLSNRNGENIEINSSDRVTVSFVMGGKTYSSVLTSVKNTTRLGDIYEMLNQATNGTTTASNAFAAITHKTTTAMISATNSYVYSDTTGATDISSKTAMLHILIDSGTGSLATFDAAGVTGTMLTVAADGKLSNVGDSGDSTTYKFQAVGTGSSLAQLENLSFVYGNKTYALSVGRGKADAASESALIENTGFTGITTDSDLGVNVSTWWSTSGTGDAMTTTLIVQAVQSDFLSTSISTDTTIGTSPSGKVQTTKDGENALTFMASDTGLAGQISGLSISIADSEGNVKKATNTALDNFRTTIYAANETADGSVSFQVGAAANQAIKVGLMDMRSEALGLKGRDGTTIQVTTRTAANAAVAAFDNAINKALDQQTTIGAISARLDYTASNLTTSSENVQAAESTIRDADMAKEMTDYTKNNVLLQAAQSMLAQANQNSSAVLSLLQ